MLYIQLSSVAQLCSTLCDLMDFSTPGFPVHHQFPELAQIHVHRVGDTIQQSHLLSSPSQSFPAMGSFLRSQFFISGGQSLGVSASTLVLPMDIRTDFLRMDCLDLLAIQGTLKSLLQHHSSKASVLQCSAFFIVRLSHPYMTTGKTIALPRWTFFGQVMSAFLIFCLG